MTFADMIDAVNGVVWALPLVGLCLLAGLYFSIRTKFVQVSGLPDMACPAGGDDGMVWHQFVVRSPERDSLRSRLALAGVGTDIHYPTAPFDQPCYAGHYDRVRFPVAAELASQVLSLPMSDYLSEAEVCHVIQATTEVTRHARAAA